ncbi:hypothetical protein IG631_14744 [Alternaria alternata]|jgi:hypothetical protein|nr:hypothetical protein IG631_14744 [Alternaria alternata]
MKPGSSRVRPVPRPLQGGEAAAGSFGDLMLHPDTTARCGKTSDWPWVHV